MPTILDVARRAKVSTYTVSVVLNNSAQVSPELKRRVLKAAAELDYTINRIASSLQTRKTMTVGMLIPDIANPWLAKVVRGVEDVCRELGYLLLLGNTYNNAEEQARYVRLFRSRQVDGLLLFMASESEGDLAPLLERRSLPVVFLGRRPAHKGSVYVEADNRLGTRMAVEHLLSRGHERIAILTGQLSLSTSSDRVTGWRQSLRKAGLRARKEYIKEGDWTAQRAHEQTLELLRLQEPPTAVIASSFSILTGVLAGVRESGRKVPDDVQVMSSDDSEWLDVFEPRISVVVQPSYEMGSEAAKLLFARLADPCAAVKPVVLKPGLKLRD